ncbi:2-phospho-L-lactate transferase [Curtobacterium ammoniigenes]|uniref:2-phospho-L-lactate transferase n=1 Tax=Curtobacterium ammoniigenes TaxID=395387 RepID=UPI00082D1F6F|nr:2-phospho-L-lactate transferase [Curtobacterium ammoniigenes]
MRRQRVTVLAGGVGGGRFACGVRDLFADQDADLRIVVNTGDDMWFAGLRVCPDLDSVMYALAGVNDSERGWGRAGESERVSAEMAAFGMDTSWFTLGDLDLGTHIARSALLRSGTTLTEATQRLSRRWELGATVLPVTDAEVPTLVDVELDGHPARIHFEEWWVRHRAAIPTNGFVFEDAAAAGISAAAAEAIRDADIVLIAPSNPIVSIAPMLAIPGVRESIGASRGRVIGVAPIIGGHAVRGMAEQCCAVVGVPATAQGVGLYYGARSAGGILDGWMVDTVDADAIGPLAMGGIHARSVPLWMRDATTTRALAAAAVELASFRPLVEPAR